MSDPLRGVLELRMHVNERSPMAHECASGNLKMVRKVGSSFSCCALGRARAAPPHCLRYADESLPGNGHLVDDASDVDHVPGKVAEALREPITLHGQPHPVTASVGVAVYPTDGTTIADLTTVADQRMYDQKTKVRLRAAKIE